MLTKNISFKNFKVKGYSKKVKKILDDILVKKNSVLDSLSSNYKNSYNKKTILKFKKKKSEGFSFDVFLEGVIQEDFKPKIEQFFSRIEMYLPFLSTYHFVIETSNTFPHSSGIASSASGMSALALCLMQVEQQIDPGISKEFFNFQDAISFVQKNPDAYVIKPCHNRLLLNARLKKNCRC